ncbi:hypothetical protein LQ327_06775 [Actinomycetospora endophytica]|uniref:Uncharacterized protein n=1 Tax=Actinomycetospora endophytica TaxID=2291215 RepID=A0ABS8P6Q4_9PSEU|nr:hypothetical protein [Actinomycetospora endophytica]MCD2193091.1 hypothetical protein [Actinomycetospora endophytica]
MRPGRMFWAVLVNGLWAVLIAGSAGAAITASGRPDAPIRVGLSLGWVLIGLALLAVTLPFLTGALRWQRTAATWLADPFPTAPASFFSVEEAADGSASVWCDGRHMVTAVPLDRRRLGDCVIRADGRDLHVDRAPTGELAVLDGDAVVGELHQVGRIAPYLVLIVGESRLLSPPSIARTQWDCLDRSGQVRTVDFSEVPVIADSGDRRSVLRTELPGGDDPQAWACLLWIAMRCRSISIERARSRTSDGYIPMVVSSS